MFDNNIIEFSLNLKLCKKNAEEYATNITVVCNPLLLRHGATRLGMC